MKVGKTYLLVSKPTSIHAAIERYCRYVLNVAIEIVNHNKLDFQDKFILYILITNPDNVFEILNALFLSNIDPEKIRTIGFNNYSDVNLLYHNALKANFEKSFSYFDPLKRKKNPYISGKISTFFKGHGQQSLLGCIGWVTYYFDNYSRMIVSDQYDTAGLYKHYLLPGLENWNEFKRRFEKHAAVIYMAGWDKQTKRVEDLITTVSTWLESTTVLKKISNFDNDILNAISEIRTILEDIEKQIHPCYGQTPASDH